MTLTSYGISDVGSVRQNNEDRILVDQPMSAFAVFDGIGGHRSGEIAAETALATLHHYLESSQNPMEVTWPYGYNAKLLVESNRLLTAIQLANRQVWRRSEESLEYSGMGTTIAAVLAGPENLSVANAGDSRVYRWRGGLIEQLTVDDTMTSALARQNLATPAQLANHPMRNVLTQAAGQREVLEVHLREEKIEPGDVLLLCSDGLHGVVPDTAMGSIVNGREDLETIARRLVEAAKSGGAPDNVSVVLARFS